MTSLSNIYIFSQYILIVILLQFTYLGIISSTDYMYKKFKKFKRRLKKRVQYVISLRPYNLMLYLLHLLIDVFIFYPFLFIFDYLFKIKCFKLKIYGNFLVILWLLMYKYIYIPNFSEAVVVLSFLYWYSYYIPEYLSYFQVVERNHTVRKYIVKKEVEVVRYQHITW